MPMLMPLCSFSRSKAHATEHAEAEHVDLHEAQKLDIVLVPFDDSAINHRGGFDGNEVVEAVAGEDEAAWMLAKVPRRAYQFPGELKG
jgi:hypothetical protein